jgi:DNA replication protein DnaC
MREEVRMLIEPTLEKLRAMRLSTMAEAFREQQEKTDIGELAFEERFGLLVDAEQLARENKRKARLLREAKLKQSQACLEEIDYAARRGLDKSTIRRLATCSWVSEHQNIVITGATGTGKTYLACAFAHQACRRGYRVLYRRASRLFEEMHLARADGSYVRMLARIARMEVLVLDDWALTKLREQERLDLLEILEDRAENRSTVMTSQLPIAKWHEQIGDPTLADAILDRVLHKAHRIVIKGTSMRKEAESKA